MYNFLFNLYLFKDPGPILTYINYIFLFLMNYVTWRFARHTTPRVVFNETPLDTRVMGQAPHTPFYAKPHIDGAMRPDCSGSANGEWPSSHDVFKKVCTSLLSSSTRSRIYSSFFNIVARRPLQLSQTRADVARFATRKRYRREAWRLLWLQAAVALTSYGARKQANEAFAPGVATYSVAWGLALLAWFQGGGHHITLVGCAADAHVIFIIKKIIKNWRSCALCKQVLCRQVASRRRLRLCPAVALTSYGGLVRVGCGRRSSQNEDGRPKAGFFKTFAPRRSCKRSLGETPRNIIQKIFRRDPGPVVACGYAGSGVVHRT
jgi:hypothetical protein